MKASFRRYFALLLLAFAPVSCRKNSVKTTNVPIKLNYTANMGGIRSWHGQCKKPTGLTGPIYDSVQIRDTFSVTIVDDKTVAIKTYYYLGGYSGAYYGFYEEDYDTLYYSSSDTIKQTYTFTESRTYVIDSLVYNYGNNSMFFNGKWDPGAYVSEFITLNTP